MRKPTRPYRRYRILDRNLLQPAVRVLTIVHLALGIAYLVAQLL